MPIADIYQFPCLSDNFGVLIHDPASGETAAIDAPEAEAVRKALRDKGWTLSQILVTHHHADHTDGILALKEETGARVTGPAGEAGKIKGLDRTVKEGDEVAVGGLKGHVIETPGHTLGHISYHFPAAEAVFVGDTIFSLGCGRVIEGDMQMMWRSLSKLMKLPAGTALYCGHEYTKANADFSLTIEPENAELKARAEEVARLRAESRPTLPTTIGRELATNPFLRAASGAIRKRLGLESAEDWQVFAEVRERKNRA
ncbi:MAG: hydroxyacylglutathione hydrolase [Hyphomicrobiaceae bacterium]